MKRESRQRRYQKKRASAESAVKARGLEGFWRLGLQVRKALDAGFNTIEVEDLLLALEDKHDQ